MSPKRTFWWNSQMRFHQASQHLYLQQNWTQTVCEASDSQSTHQVGSAQGSLMLSQASANCHCLGCKTSPLQQGSLHGRNTGLPSPPPHCAKGHGSRTSRAQLILAAPYRDNIFPFQVTGKTRESQTRLTGKAHQTDSKPDTQVTPKMLKTKFLKAFLNKSAVITWSKWDWHLTDPQWISQQCPPVPASQTNLTPTTCMQL